MSTKKPTLELYQLLQTAYDKFNDKLFGSKLPEVLITLQRERNTMGYFSQNRWLQNKPNENETVHEIAINPAYFAAIPLIEVLQTFVHEMCHLYQHEHGQPSRGRYHNSEFGEIMKEVGLMPSTTGKPGGAQTGQKMADYPIEGGEFINVCLELYESGFFLPWIDRYPATKMRPSPEPSSPAEYYNNFSVLSEQVEPEQIATLKALHVDMVSPQSQPMIVTKPDKEKKAKKNSKTRYQCKCRINIWGKPDLLVRCNLCETNFIASH